MGSASNTGQPLGVVMFIGTGALIASGLAAAIAISTTRRHSCERPAYDADDGPLSESAYVDLRRTAANALPAGVVVKKTSLF
jgi:hypothetical protein